MIKPTRESVSDFGAQGKFANLHVVGIGNLAFLVTDNWESQLATRDLIDVLDPTSVLLNGVGGQTDQLDAPSGEFRLKLGEGTEFGGADGCVIVWVGEQDNPFVANELMEVDGTLGGLSLEIRCDGAQSEARKEQSVAVIACRVAEMMDVKASTVNISKESLSCNRYRS